MFISAPTLDDLLREVFSSLLKTGNPIRPSRGKAVESIAVLLQLKNPRARLSLTETKGKLSSCLGELLWYLAGSKNLGFIAYYLPRYKKESEDGRTVFGGYGPRLFSMRRRHNQVKNILSLLKKRDSRRAVIQILDAADTAKKHKEIPCTCTLQFMVRHGRLHMFTNMRSNDAYLGLPHDVFAFTMLQEIFARTLGVELGTYSHAVGSLHLYECHRKNAQQYLQEGWQPTTKPMPAMPKVDPWPSIAKIVGAERSIRKGKQLKAQNLGLHAYWADLVRILQVYWFSKLNEIAQIEELKSEMSHRVYDSYISAVIAKLEQRKH
jgi:thymidylate synthase